MATTGIDYVYLETHDLEASRRFWTALGFEVVLDLGHAYKLRPPVGGAGIFVELVPDDHPLAFEVYLAAHDANVDPGPDVDVVKPFEPSHWDTQLMQVRDPDGRTFLLQAGGVT